MLQMLNFVLSIKLIISVCVLVLVKNKTYNKWYILIYFVFFINPTCSIQTKPLY